MKITTEQYERIIRFLDVEMEPDEMDAFERELFVNPDMRRQLDFEQSVRDSFSLGNTTSRLPEIKAENKIIESPQKSGKVPGIQKWFAIAAAVITAFMFFVILWQSTEKLTVTANRKDINTTQERSIQPNITITPPISDSSTAIDLSLLFKIYFKKDTLPEEYPLYLAEAFTDFESGKYTTLEKLDLDNLPLTRGVKETDSNENILLLGHYYKGLAFLQIENTKDAITNLNWVLSSQPGKTLLAKTQWYLALAHIKENNSEKAVELCRSVIKGEENAALVKNAKTILYKIEK